jgi:hypothetical protein
MGFAALAIVVLICHSSPLTSFSRANQAANEASVNIVACWTLEAHASAQPPVTVVIFHHRDKVDQERLGMLLRQNDGADVEVKVGNAGWQKIVVERLRSCFGRGFLILPANATTPKDGKIFILKFPPPKGAH